MGTDKPGDPIVERFKRFRPSRKVRRAMVQVVFALLSMALLAQTAGVVLRLAGVM